MPRPEYKSCRECGLHVSIVGPLSHSRLCVECGERRAIENNRGIATRSGPFALHWKRRNYMAARRELLDDVREPP